MDAMFTFSEEELNTGAIHSHDESASSSPSTSSMLTPTIQNVARTQIKRPTTLNVSKPSELVLRDTTNAENKSDNSPIKSVQKRQQKKKKRRTAHSYSDISFDDKYKLTEELLGTGAHGVVKTCRDRMTKQEYAVKIISKARHPDRTRVFKEIDIYSHCRSCENILSIIDFLEDDNYFYLVFQKMEGGPLLNHIMKRGRLTERETSLIVRDIANGLNFLHSKGMSHRDLKPENILVERADSLIPIKLCDFDLGSAIRLNSNKTTPITTPELSTPVGSVEFMAPEVVDAWTSLAGSLQLYDKRCDLWSLGVIIYIMLCGYPPFYGSCGHTCGWTKGEECEQCQSLLFERIQDGEFNFPEKDWKYISNGAKDLIKRLLVRDASLRLTAAEVLQHPWVKNSQELDNERPLNTPELLQRHDSIRRLESFTKDALSITKLIEERKRMIHYRSHSTDSLHRRSRTSSHDDADDDDDEETFNELTPNITKRRIIRKKKKSQQTNINDGSNAVAIDDDEDENQNFEGLRRRLSSATMTSGEEDIGGDDETFGCSFKTVIHRPITNFYLPSVDSMTSRDYSPSTDNGPQETSPQTPIPLPLPPPLSMPPVQSMMLTPTQLISVPPSQVPIVMFPSPQITSPMHYRAHTETDLLYYQQQQHPRHHHHQHHPRPLLPQQQTMFHPANWYPQVPAVLFYGPPGSHHPPPFIMQQTNYRSSSVDCRRTANDRNEHHIIHPERVW